MSGCACQQFGKSGVPHVTSWRCLVCGEPVAADRPFVCPAYRPDEADEDSGDPAAVCRICGAPPDAHTYAARALGEAR